MTQASSTISLSDGTTTVVYDLQTPSSGDRNPAIYQASTPTSATRQQRSNVTISARPNGKKNARYIDIRMSLPCLVNTDATGNTKTTQAVSLFTGTLLLPTNAAITETDKMSSLVASLMNDAMIKSVLKNGFAPT